MSDNCERFSFTVLKPADLTDTPAEVLATKTQKSLEAAQRPHQYECFSEEVPSPQVIHNLLRGPLAESGINISGLSQYEDAEIRGSNSHVYSLIDENNIHYCVKLTKRNTATDLARGIRHYQNFEEEFGYHLIPQAHVIETTYGTFCIQPWLHGGRKPHNMPKYEILNFLKAHPLTREILLRLLEETMTRFDSQQPYFDLGGTQQASLWDSMNIFLFLNGDIKQCDIDLSPKGDTLNRAGITLDEQGNVETPRDEWNFDPWGQAHTVRYYQNLQQAHAEIRALV